MTGLPLVIFSKYWFPLRSVPTKRARDPILSRDFSQDIAVITIDWARDELCLGTRLVVSRNETRFFFFGGKRRGEHSNWRRRAGKDHHAAESGYAAAEILFEMLAQLLGDGRVRLTGR